MTDFAFPRHGLAPEAPPAPLLRTKPRLTPLTDEAPVVLDLSRLLSRALHVTPTGIDRVEMAYARELARMIPERLSHAAILPTGTHMRLDFAAVADFLAETEARWALGDPQAAPTRGLRLALKGCLAARLGAKRSARTGAYLHLSPRGLERRALYKDVLARWNVRLVPLVHDLIPLEHPEFARPGGGAMFARKLATVTALSSGILVNSEATARALAPYLARAGNSAPVRVAPLGVPATRPSSAPPPAPYFVVLSTIEPRKNHLLLLHLWRRMAETRPPEAVPRLVLIGRRGWENENILDLLDRAPALAGCVVEHGRLPDSEMRRLLSGAAALLCPSFAEGYGLSVAEALEAGTPVIASDIAALREVGGEAAEYLDPLDSPAWARAVDDYAVMNSARRTAQISRMRQWQPPRWSEHMRIALDLIDEVVR
ncbi:glycosyltransferase family 1 protein [Caulobacter sp. CCNWLY153]|uniref:glycosyltransferase family 4 protein n=1 Tax=unclassified Caulobacter TaxID=2648921 RepID=UPI002FF1BC55